MGRTWQSARPNINVIVMYVHFYSLRVQQLYKLGKFLSLTYPIFKMRALGYFT